MHAIVEGKQMVFISDFAPKELRGMALGTSHIIIGLATRPSGIIAGVLWGYVNPTATFLYGSVSGFLAATLLALKKIA